MVWRDNKTMRETKVPSEVTAFISARIQENIREDHWVKMRLIAVANARRK
jgi:chromosomal replication initiation ATPase DnaA